MSGKDWEGSAEDKRQDVKLAKKHGMSFEKWEASDMDVKHDKQKSMKGLKRGGAFGRINPMKAKRLPATPVGPGKVPKSFIGKAKGGSISARADGCCSHGKTKGKMV